MRLLVTGATGYLGAALVRRAPELGWDVRGASSRDADVRNPDAVARLIGEVRPDVVVHTAYRQVPSEDAWAVNVDGAANVARSSAGLRLVHVSTDVVFSGAKGRYTEDDEPDPVTDYGRSKAAAEHEVRAAHPEALVVRTSLIYGGPGCAQSKHEEAAHDPANTFFTDERRSPVQVNDLATALLTLAHGSERGFLHVAGADDVSRCEFARLIAGDAVRCAPVPPDAIRPRDCTLDSNRAQRLLSIRLRGCREVLGAP